jgi:hypothetical protein
MAAEVVLRALQRAWVSLEPLHVPMAVMGGLALAAWKHVRATRDVDLLVGVGGTTPEAIVDSLIGAGMRPKRQPAIQPLGQFHLLQMLFEPPDSFLELEVDILFAESEYQEAALGRRVALRLSEMDTDLFVLACEDLVIHKLLAGRAVDRADAAALLRANRPTLDLAWLNQWVHRLGLGPEWAEVWRETFPGEAAPVTA